MSYFKSLLCLSVLLSLCDRANAAVVLQYDLNGVPLAAPATLNATTVANGLTGKALSRGAGVTASNLTNGFSAQGWEGPTTVASAITEGNYFQFGLSFNDGFKGSLSSLDLSLRRSAIAAPMNMQIQGSLDGFATNFVVSSFNYFGRASGTAPAQDPLLNDPFFYMTNDLPGRPNAVTSIGDAIPTIDLTTITELQNLKGGADVTFRLFAWGTASTASTNSLAFGRMTGPTIGGSVTAVPEPSTFAILGAAMICSGLTRKFRKKQLIAV